MSAFRFIFKAFPQKFSFQQTTQKLHLAKYVTLPQRKNIKKAEKSMELEVGLNTLQSIVPLEQKTLLREDTLTSQLVNTIMRDGRKISAQKIVNQALLIIKKETNNDPYKVLADAIELGSPLMTLISKSKRQNAEKVPYPLTIRQRRRQAIVWILEDSKKRREHKFHERLAAEILAIINGTSGVLVKKLARHKAILASRSQIKIIINK
ncbi:hypothetical protein BB561_000397 [Smittium simulii]|uniref:Small ribosomal subunit protein uS7 domain-containing protein n=1 Tax=Smittium simulii TaxID=133385 RepID=A0A2T9YZL9_9FUNG|nr:hypothetical protein BB561_000397 [Smittium simulii]